MRVSVSYPPLLKLQQAGDNQSEIDVLDFLLTRSHSHSD